MFILKVKRKGAILSKLEPAEITESIFEDIRVFFDSRTKIEGFAAALLSKKIETIPDERHKEIARAWLLTIKNDEKGFIEAYESFCRRLQLVDFNEFHIFSTMFRYLGRNTDSHSLINEGIEKVVSVKLLEAAAANSIINLSIDDFQTHFQSLKKMNKLDIFEQHQQKIAAKEYDILKGFVANNYATEEQLRFIGNIVFKLADEYTFSLRANRINFNYEQDWLSITYFTQQDFSSETIYEMNEKIIDELILNDLDLLPIVIQFRRINNMDNFTSKEEQQVKNVD